MTAPEQGAPADRWRHGHTFGQDRPAHGERRTLAVAAITAVFMVVEVVAGKAYGSMALLADGLHMGSHALALGIAAGAYLYARRRAGDPRFSFGTGKVNALAGFTGALLLALFAFGMAWESIERLRAPVAIGFDQAIAVAVVGLLVNGLSVWILGVDHDHGPGGHHDHGRGHEDAHHAEPGHGHHGEPGHAHHGEPRHAHHGEPRHAHHGEPGHDHHGHDHHGGPGHGHHGHDDHGHDPHGHDHHGGPGHAHRGEHRHAGHGGHGHCGQDHNLRSAYLHVLADALTSVLAIVALVAGKWTSVVWLDPAMGILGGLLVARWSWGLLRASSAVLLDHQAPDAVRERVRAALAGDGDEVVDLHVWEIGPGVHACCVTIVAQEPRSPDAYRAQLPDGLGIVHATVEVHRAASAAATPVG